MNTTNHRLGLSTAALALLLSTLNPQLSTVLAQGPLAPPGAPTPTMKTLDQIEPRTPIDTAHTPGDANFEAIIGAPGSYYLTGNLGVSKPNGIHVTAAGVTIDLNGFEITRSSGGGGDGIKIEGAAHGCAISNGSITTFANGVNTNAGTRQVAIRRVRAANCTSEAVIVGPAGQIVDCLAHDNTGTAAISASNGCTLTNCITTNNTANYAIVVGSGCTLRDCISANNFCGVNILTQNACALHNCIARNNTGFSGISVTTGCVLTNCSVQGTMSTGNVSSGIVAGNGSTLIGCSSRDNTSTAGPVASAGMGINVDRDCTIKDCAVNGNQGNGIRVNANCLVIGNEVGGNGNGGDGAGIHVLGDDNRIEGNNVVKNDRGIDVDAAGNIIVRNTASGNTINNWDVVAGNVILVYNATAAGAVVGNNGGAAPGPTTDPSANFTY